MSFSNRLIGTIGSRPVSGVASALTSRRLRIIAYHGMDTPQSFARQIEHLVARYRTVSGTQVAQAARGEIELPSRAVWVTFDDGHPEVVTEATGVLATSGITATMFVCPGVIDTTTPYWWEIVRRAEALNIRADVIGRSPDGALESTLKSVVDGERRAIVTELSNRISARTGEPMQREQLTSQQLRTWINAGHEIGNHSWDHPLLDRCAPSDQVAQVRLAHDWLHHNVAPPVKLFAYPNGNWSPVVEQELQELGYEVAVGFDHHLTSPAASPLRLSRLRADADAPIARYRSIVSGTHSGLLTARRSLIDRAAVANDPREMPA